MFWQVARCREGVESRGAAWRRRSSSNNSRYTAAAAAATCCGGLESLIRTLQGIIWMKRAAPRAIIHVACWELCCVVDLGGAVTGDKEASGRNPLGCPTRPRPATPRLAPPHISAGHASSQPEVPRASLVKLSGLTLRCRTRPCPGHAPRYGYGAESIRARSLARTLMAG